MLLLTHFSPLIHGLISMILAGNFVGTAGQLSHKLDTIQIASKDALTCADNVKQGPAFIAMGGGGAPSYNEIALEKNIRYFQRTLCVLGYRPEKADAYFANGNDGKATVRYLDKRGKQRFKVPEIPYLKGASTRTNLQAALQQLGQQRPPSVFLYFTGHGFRNHADLENNTFMLWERDGLSVQQFVSLLNRLPPDLPVVTVMTQCYAGSFANLIYQDGAPTTQVALQTRCGFFATIKTKPSVGCTPEVNEADYRDYSSSFFAGLSGYNRLGKPIALADYNRDRQVSYAEAHAFAKVDGETTDLPISTLEAWLQRQAETKGVVQKILDQPIAQLLKTARPEQAYVVSSLVQKYGFSPQVSLKDAKDQNVKRLEQTSDHIQNAYLQRLRMELINIGMEHQLRSTANTSAIAILDKLIQCESGFWNPEI
jgi:hypothetical protein